MSVLKWVKRTPSCSNTVGLPEDKNEETDKINVHVNDTINKKSTAKRGPYTILSPVKRAEIGQYARLHGNAKAARHFSISESTIRNIKKKHIQAEKAGMDMKELKHGLQGRPLLLGPEIDRDVQLYLTKMRAAGGIVNRSIAIAAATGKS